ncbi:MAG: MarR family transcriptional regulator [Rhizorhabdus sp.]
MTKEDHDPGRQQGGAVAAQRFLDHFVPFHLYRVTVLAASRAAEDYRTLGISVPEARLLMAVMKAGSLPAGELSELLSVERSLLSHMMRHLVQKGMVQRDRDTLHRRFVRVSLTDAGIACARLCHEASAQHEAELLSGFTPAERELLKTLLDRLYRNLTGGRLADDEAARP